MSSKLIYIITIIINFNTPYSADLICPYGGVTDFHPSINDRIICTRDCLLCQITCTTQDQCKQITLYSAALTNKIKCFGQSSCEDSIFYFGEYKIPNGYTLELFQHNQNYINITCNGNASCKSSEIYIKGDISNDVTIYADTSISEIDNFEASIIDCNLLDGQSCILNCGINGDCYDTQFICRNGNCLCNGNYCNSLKDGGIISVSQNPTVFPSNPSLYPTRLTQYPTIIPTKYPTYVPTNIPIKISTINPTIYPSFIPTINPTKIPSVIPSLMPTQVPNIMSSIVPTKLPTVGNTNNTDVPTINNITQIITTVSAKQLNQNRLNLGAIIIITALCVIVCLLAFIIILLCIWKKKLNKEKTVAQHVNHNKNKKIGEMSPKANKNKKNKSILNKNNEGMPMAENVAVNELQNYYETNMVKKVSFYIDHNQKQSSNFSKLEGFNDDQITRNNNNSQHSRESKGRIRVIDGSKITPENSKSTQSKLNKNILLSPQISLIHNNNDDNKSEDIQSSTYHNNNNKLKSNPADDTDDDIDDIHKTPGLDMEDIGILQNPEIKIITKLEQMTDDTSESSSITLNGNTPIPNGNDNDNNNNLLNKIDKKSDF